MVLDEYLTWAANLLSEEKRRYNSEKKCLQTVLVQLKSREDMLDAQLTGDQPDNVRKAIERERKVVCAQRRKGLHLLGELDRKQSRRVGGLRWGVPHLAG